MLLSLYNSGSVAVPMGGRRRRSHALKCSAVPALERPGDQQTEREVTTTPIKLCIPMLYYFISDNDENHVFPVEAAIDIIECPSLTLLRQSFLKSFTLG